MKSPDRGFLSKLPVNIVRIVSSFVSENLSKINGKVNKDQNVLLYRREVSKMVKLFTEEELDKLMFYIIRSNKTDCLKARDVLIYRILKYTGARISEVLKMRIDQLDLKNNLWIIPTENSKNRLEQRVFLIPSLKRMLEGYISEYKHYFKEGYLMFTVNKSLSIKYKSKHYSVQAWEIQHKNYLRKIGLLEVVGYKKNGTSKYARNTHSIRSLYTIQIYKKLVVTGQINFLEISKLLRHKDLRSTLLYLNNLGLGQEETQRKWLPKVFD